MLKLFLRKSILALALVALAGNLALPAFAAVKSSGSPTATQNLSVAQTQAAEFFGKILICTITGYKWVSIDDLRKGKIPETAHKGQTCPLCTFSGQGLAALGGFGGGYVIWAPLTAPLVYLPHSDNPHTSLPSPKIKHTRAPPYSVHA